MQLRVKRGMIYGAILCVWITITAYQIMWGFLSTDIIEGMCVPYGVFSSYAVEKTLGVLVFLIAYLLPLTLMIFFYSKCVYALRSKVTSFKQHRHRLSLLSYGIDMILCYK